MLEKAVSNPNVNVVVFGSGDTCKQQKESNALKQRLTSDKNCGDTQDLGHANEDNAKNENSQPQ